MTLATNNELFSVTACALVSALRTAAQLGRCLG
jgi:hypothetical protein